MHTSTSASEPFGNEGATQWPGARGYLNTARFGLPCARAVAAAANQVGHWGTGHLDRYWLEDVEPLRTAFAALVGLPAKAIGVGRSTSSLIAGVACSLPDGATVLVPEGEHNSNVIPFLEQRHRAVRVVSAPLALLAQHVVPGVDVVAFSLVQSSDGRIADLVGIAAAAREAGALICVDGTQAVGWLPFDAALCDVLVVSAYKWLMAPVGLAFIGLGPFTEWIRPATPNWFAGTDPMAAPFGTEFEIDRTARRFDVVPALGVPAAAHASLLPLLARGVSSVYRHNVSLADRLREQLGLQPAGSAIVTIAQPGAASRLAAAGIRCTSWGDQVRLSFHLYSDVADVDRVVLALQA